MASSLFPSSQGDPAKMAASAMRQQGPDAVFNSLMGSNPQFRQFVEQNRGKTPEQIAREHGIDFAALRSRIESVVAKIRALR
ncbi:hypothetical protein [uncultured Senegalimassilia sp.]|uniref:ECF sigma factor n=1 Tax=Siphoviridae sp. ctqBc4 TaxID=2827945 RepID=A0A8S5SCC1_9CAUD|nr:hypothetical protein [uncultured Senegalimassilia sp.]DAF48613.1 MAG TPA: ECF sigma factor [Siphoviridae sp. ctqBc4]